MNGPSSAGREVPAGAIEVERLHDDWLMVAIGRGRKTKRFNLTRGEVAELVRVLREQVLTQDGGGL
jgi:hypothetical protein